MSDDIHYLSLIDVSGRIRRGELSSVDVTEALLERINRLDGHFHSFISVMTQSARAQAEQADREIRSGFWRGLLHGVPLAVKDLLYTEGWPTTAGMDILKGFIPPEDATVVRRLKTAGAVLLGKLHMTEGATMDHHPTLPRPVNPWSETHWTGVSSSGSGVAPAAGLCFGALGTDTGGSIRMPSAANSLSGIKPTWGRVSRHGLIHLAESLDHIGPMARTVADAAAILQVIAGADKSDPTALSVPVPNFMKELGGGLTDVVVGVDWDFAGSGAPDALTQAVDHAVSALESLGARVREVKVPDTDAVSSLILPMMMAEVAAAHADYFPGNADRYGPRLRGMVEGARQLDTLSVVRAYQARARFNGALDAVFRDIDILVTPGIGMILPTWDEVEAMSDDMDLMSRTLMKFTLPFNLSGAPTLSLPGGFTHDGLPIGLQFIAKRQQEGQLVRAGHAYQSVTDFHTRHPIP